MALIVKMLQAIYFEAPRANTTTDNTPGAQELARWYVKGVREKTSNFVSAVKTTAMMSGIIFSVINLVRIELSTSWWVYLFR